MSIPVYIVDDEMHGIQGLTALIKRVPGLDLKGYDTDPLAAVNKITSGLVEVDILFADIDMPDMNGLKMSELLGQRVLIIFVTAYSHYAIDAFGPAIVDFLTKPVDPVKFMRAVEWATMRLTERKGPFQQPYQRHIYLRLGQRHVINVKLKEIIYIKASDKYIEIYLGKDKPLIVKKTLNDMQDILPDDQFMRVHKSYIVNFDYVEAIVDNKINMEKASSIEIGSTYMKAVYSRFDSV